MDVKQFQDSGSAIDINESIPDGSTVCFVDSSYNPPNMAHMKLAHLCRQSFPGSYIVFLLAIGNADKPAAPVEQLEIRMKLMDVLKSSEMSDDSKVRLGLTTQARFIDKAEAVHDLLPKCRSVFAMGYDTLVRFGDQSYYDVPIAQVVAQFFRDVEVVLLTRNVDGVSKSTFGIESASKQRQLLATHPVFSPFANKIHIYEAVPETEQVSSSRAKMSLSELHRCVPKSVVQYILENKLYGF